MDTGKGEKVRTATLEVVISGARALKNTKWFGKMSPTVLVAISSTQLYQVGAPALNGGASPSWDQSFSFEVPESVLESRDPMPTVRVEIYDSAELSKSLGYVVIPLARPIAHYDQPWVATQAVLHKDSVKGYLSFTIKCEKPSFAPPRGTSEYDSFVRSLAPPEASAPAKPAPYGQGKPGNYGPAAAGAAAGAGAAAARPRSAQQQQQAYGYPHRGYARPAYGYAQTGYPAYGYPAGRYPPQYGGTTTYTSYPKGYRNYPPPYGAPAPQVVVVEERRRYGCCRGRGAWCGGPGLGLLAGAAGGLLLGEALF